MQTLEAIAQRSSRIPGFYKMSLEARRDLVVQWADLTADEADVLEFGGLSNETASDMIENAIGMHELPLGLAANFQINGRDYLIPMGG